MRTGAHVEVIGSHGSHDGGRALYVVCYGETWYVDKAAWTAQLIAMVRR